jgi:hypothetical protein
VFVSYHLESSPLLEKMGEMADTILSLKKQLQKMSSTSSLLPAFNAMGLVPLLTAVQTHAFLTHNWGSQADNFENHRRVAKIYRILEKNYNMKMWFDEVYLNDNILQEITSGLLHTRCMIVFITKEYDRKISGQSEGGIYCQLEFEQGFRRFFTKGRLIPVIMEPEMLDSSKWSAALQGVFGGKLYFDFSKMISMTDDELSTKCQELFDFIMKKLKESV